MTKVSRRRGQVLLDVAIAGPCGSDLHVYNHGRIGSAVIGGPFPSHEFAGCLFGSGR